MIGILLLFSVSINIGLGIMAWMFCTERDYYLKVGATVIRSLCPKYRDKNICDQDVVDLMSDSITTAAEAKNDSGTN